MSRWSFGAGRLGLVHGDITRARVDAVVNAANSRLAGGGGVDGAIQRAAGPKLLQAGLDIVASRGRLPAGEAAITPGFELFASHVIHTIGPVYGGGSRGEAEILASAYRRSLELAADHGLLTIAFPAISCGIYGYPQELAAPIALGVVAEALAEGLAKEVFFYLHTPSSLDVWTRAAHSIFGPPGQDQG